ncbi:MAG: anticodon nuclease [Spirochaetes bacterium GWF1_31_7]|nr:MAG: anticodon nuclease [Spirochaetes bacterium GWE1_32_154]OHD50825.1 MAG: anticodon nuclease [Spirochaetes bacterium GWE2_31_10]OHD52762.1 MAG: anticodon nuclease [Spirochaetes bacterium GWF1_31_7]OHD81705.1 MAG: anticodon nuclease [Spirochaetes bacterium RIFOXYB1_FULL_32_8]HBD95440.1 anticodon nuclease [Spirochaetia bacterium]
MSTIEKFNNLADIASHFRKDLTGDHRPMKDLILFFAHNGTGKTRLSMEFNQAGKQFDVDGNVAARDTLYFNAFTEDLFSWNNDLENDTNRFIKLNSDSIFFKGLHELDLDVKIESFFHNYTDLTFDINYKTSTVTFLRSIVIDGTEQKVENIKISRGEENLFIWCFFLAICQLAIDKDPAYDWVKYIYIDDPISSLDENNAISVACDLANLVTREDNETKTVISTHHSLFFNVLYNEFGRKLKNKRYFLHFKDPDEYSLHDTGDTPFFQHIAILSELKQVVESNKIYTYHFNALRSILEKTAGFFGYDKIDKCIHGLEDEILFERALQLFSHGKYSIFDPKEMEDDNKSLFKRILDGFLSKYEFYFPDIFNEENTEETT